MQRKVFEKIDDGMVEKTFDHEMVNSTLTDCANLQIVLKNQLKDIENMRVMLDQKTQELSEKEHKRSRCSML